MTISLSQQLTVVKIIPFPPPLVNDNWQMKRPDNVSPYTTDHIAREKYPATGARFINIMHCPPRKVKCLLWSAHFFYRFAQNPPSNTFVFVHFNRELNLLFFANSPNPQKYEFFHPFYSLHASFLPNFELLTFMHRCCSTLPCCCIRNDKRRAEALLISLLYIMYQCMGQPLKRMPSASRRRARS